MSQQIPPVQQLEFHGLHLAGNPIGRPRGTAAVCSNVRVMPGFWLRARGGYKARANAAGNWTQFRSFRPPDFPGSTAHIGQIKFTSGANNGQVWWNWFSVYPAYLITPTPSERIFTTYDGGFANSKPVAVTNLSDRLLVYNGLGVRDGANSRPPFTSIASDMNRYFGLDAYCPGSKPTVSWAGGAGNNKVVSAVDIYVGLYHPKTEHYSNAVKVGAITTQAGTGTITVSNLQRLSAAYHSTAERDELYYVFYATVDSSAVSKVPYMIFDVDMLGPLKVAVTSTSASLSVASGTDNGWVLNVTKEAPFDNHPPRPMRDIALCSGRLYGSLMEGGSGIGGDFQYPPTGKEMGAVVWSRAFGDVKTVDQLGDPLQSWPLRNIAHTPTYEQPIALHPDLDEAGLIVCTSTSTFILLELSDGIHSFQPISRVHGIKLKTTMVATPYGLIWVTQRNQIVMLERGSRTVVVLSDPYQDALTGKTPTCADYLLDPVNQIDRYEVFFSDGTSLCHDFALGGEAYTCSRKNATAAMTAVDSIGRQHFLFANTGIYTHEAQPEDGLIPTTDQVFDAGLQTFQTHQIDGEYVRNWDDFGDANVRKELLQVDVIGDAGPSAALANARAIAVEWYGDFEEVKESNKAVTTPAPIQQSTTNSTYPFKLSKFHQFWFKIRLKFRGHSSDDASFATHASPATQGDRAKNFYGCILGVFAHLGRITENRA